MSPDPQPMQIVGLGLTTIDVLARMQHMPSWDRGTQLDDLALDGGGPVGTALVAAARLGARVGYLGTAGCDEAAELKVRLMSQSGVDTSQVVRRPTAEMQIILVCVNAEGGERVFSSTPRTGNFPLRPDEIPRAYIEQAKYLHLDGYHIQAALQAADWMHAAGGFVMLDAAKSVGTVSEELRALVCRSDFVISGAGFAKAFTGLDDLAQAAPAVLAKGPRVFVETVGEHGCFTAASGVQFHTPAYAVNVVDTTGAGDVFHGAYLVGLLHGWNLHRIAQFASATAAIKCTHLGGRRGIPSYAEVIQFLAQRQANFPDFRE